jgi:catechol 2,3-dioxygenase-like lactoylglutathione lyase family enzyme
VADEEREPQVRFGYAILYVRDVAASVDFYERAFGLERRLVHESGQYAEMETGATALAFAAHELAAANVPDLFKPAAAGGDTHPAFEVCLVTENVEAAYARAVEAGAAGVSEPQTKPWGQQVAYVRDPDGMLVELASPA